MSIQCVVFDLDGTLTYFTFPVTRCKVELGMTGRGLLEFINALPEDKKQRAWEVLEKYEWEYARKAIMMEGAKEVIEKLKERGLLIAVITRGTKDYASHILKRHGVGVDILVDRNDCKAKPSKESVLLVSKRFNIGSDSILVVGDTGYDIESGRRAGAKTVLFHRRAVDKIPDEIIIEKSQVQADFQIEKLEDVLEIIDNLR